MPKLEDLISQINPQETPFLKDSTGKGFDDCDCESISDIRKETKAIKKVKELSRFSKTKALGFFIAIAATLYGFMHADSGTMLSGWGMALFLIGGKTSINSYLKSKGVYK